MSAHRWPAEAEIPTMSAEEAYDLYYGLPAPQGPDQLRLIRALGDHAWQQRQQDEAGMAKPIHLPMPEKAAAAEDAPAPLPTKRPKFKLPAPAPAAAEDSGGSLFFLQALKKSA